MMLVWNVCFLYLSFHGEVYQAFEVFRLDCVLLQSFLKIYRFCTFVGVFLILKLSSDCNVLVRGSVATLL